MDVYRQAANIIDMVRAGKGTAKALCLQKEMQKKKQTYAVVCETLRHYELLMEVLASAQFFDYYPHADPSLAAALAYDAVIGRGINTKQHDVARAVVDSLPFLRSAYFKARPNFIIPPKEEDRYSFPRYARVNPLLGKSADDVWKALIGRKREEDSEESAAPSEGTTAAPDAAVPQGANPKRVHPRLNPKWDEHVPSLLVFPPRTDLHAHPLVRRHHLVLQDKSSCIPAAVLLDAVPVTRFAKDGRTPAVGLFVSPTYVIDGCAAPGNKTTQLAALGAPTIQLMAIERDARRFALLEKRVQQFGAAELVNAINGNFYTLGSEERAVTDAILLDPSCTASGVVSRVDVALAGAGSTDPVGDDDPSASERVETLAKVQRGMVAHALLSFDRCWRVVYSTCSINDEENEEVVAAVMGDERVTKRGWRLSSIMPDTWKTRGRFADPERAAAAASIPVDRCIRCDPDVDQTNGFFVACFDRDPPKDAIAAASVVPKTGEEL